MSVRYTTIEEIIQHAIGEEDLDARSAAKLVPIAVRGWNTIYREATSEIKTEILTVDDIFNFSEILHKTVNAYDSEKLAGKSEIKSSE